MPILSLHPVVLVEYSKFVWFIRLFQGNVHLCRSAISKVMKENVETDAKKISLVFWAAVTIKKDFQVF